LRWMFRASSNKPMGNPLFPDSDEAALNKNHASAMKTASDSFDHIIIAHPDGNVQQYARN